MSAKMGLFLVGKVSKVELAMDDDGLSKAVLEYETFDRDLERDIPASLTALFFKEQKSYLQNYMNTAAKADICAIPLMYRKSQKGGFFAVSGDVLDLHELATIE